MIRADTGGDQGRAERLIPQRKFAANISPAVMADTVISRLNVRALVLGGLRQNDRESEGN